MATIITSGKTAELRKAFSDQDILAAASSIIEARIQRSGKFVTDSQLARDLFTFRIADSDREVMSVAFLTNANELLCVEDMFYGTYNAATVYPREIAKRALELNAGSVVISHNHPSGTLVPSTADKQITKRIAESLAVLDIRLLDHILVADNATLSFSEQGLM